MKKLLIVGAIFLTTLTASAEEYREFVGVILRKQAVAAVEKQTNSFSPYIKVTLRTGGDNNVIYVCDNIRGYNEGSYCTNVNYARMLKWLNEAHQ